LLKPEVIDALVAAGVTAEQLAAAMKADHAQEEVRRAAKREKDAERQRRYRLSRSVTRDNALQGVTPRDPPSPEVSPTPPSYPLSPKENPPKGGQKKRAGRIPPDYQPDIGAAEVEGLSRAQAEREARKFIDYFLGAPGEKGLKQDWAATWRNWVRRAAELGGSSPSTGPPEVVKFRTVEEIFAAVEERKRAEAAAANAGDQDVSGSGSEQRIRAAH
jgi:hypothetical protein